MDYTSAETQVVYPTRPRERVRELKLTTKDVGGSRLADGERHSPASRVGGRKDLSFPERDRIAIQVGKLCLVEKTRVEDPRVIDLSRP